MATSPIYGWAEPDNTDLVKNGALAIRTLGNAIDTTMGTMTPKSTYTAKGSIAAATAASTPANLAVGNNGEVLVADSSTATGLRYQGTQAAGKNYVINGSFDFWQRATTYALTTTAGAYGAADRWSNSQDSAAGATASQITTGLPSGLRYGLKVQRNNGTASTGSIRTAQVLETATSIPFAGQAVTLSFWAKAGANFSAASNYLVSVIATGTGTDQSSAAMAGGSWTGYAQVANTATLTTSWQRFSYTTTLGSSITQIGLTFYDNPVGTAGADDSYQITGVQLELGSVATSLTRAGGTVAGELAACQRYYWRTSGSENGNALLGGGIAQSANEFNAFVNHPVQMRVSPTLIEYSGTRVVTIAAGVNAYASPTSVTLASGNGSTTRSLISWTKATTFVISNAGWFSLNGGSDYFGLGAEL
jgi:hypothetical protein